MVHVNILIFVCCQSFSLVISHEFQTMGKTLPHQKTRQSKRMDCLEHREKCKRALFIQGVCEHAGVAEAQSVWQYGEKQYCREGQGLALKDVSCLLSELELFLVGNPVSRERFDTAIGVIRLHFRSVSGSSVEEDGSEGTERETDASLRKPLRSPRELMVA